MSRAEADPRKIRRLLIVLPSWVGDTVMATPLLRALRAHDHLANAHITGYMRASLDEILAGTPFLDEMIVGRPERLFGPMREARRLRAMHFDAAILLPNSFRLAFTVRLARIPIRIGYGRDGRSWMLTHAMPCPRPGGWKDPIPAVEYYLHLAESLGIDGEQIDHRLQLASTSEQDRMSVQLLREIGITEGEGFALLNPGGNREDKRWPAERFAQLAEHLSREHDLAILINGSPGERTLVQQICEQVAEAGGSWAVNLQEYGITLGSLKGICKRARIVVTNDTGTRHIAVGMNYDALNTAQDGAMSAAGIVTLFGPTDPAWTTLDYPRENEIATGNRGPVSEITIEQVIEACERLLDTKAP